MNGFYISITNRLLDPKHKDAMGTAVWEFMWLLDKITKIDEGGVGWVLGGKPINIEDIRKDLGGDEKTVRRNLQRLEEEGYIRKIRTPRGISIRVAKAKKPFGKSVRTKMSVRSGKNVRSNIRQLQDNKQRTHSRANASLNRKGMEVHYEDDEGNPIRPRKKPKREGKNKIAIRICHRFVEEVEKRFGWKPAMAAKEYVMAVRAITNHEMTESQVYDLFDEWFGLDKKDEDLVQMSQALSTNQINRYKARNL